MKKQFLLISMIFSLVSCDMFSTSEDKCLIDSECFENSADIDLVIRTDYSPGDTMFFEYTNKGNDTILLNLGYTFCYLKVFDCDSQEVWTGTGIRCSDIRDAELPPMDTLRIGYWDFLVNDMESLYIDPGRYALFSRIITLEGTEIKEQLVKNYL